MVTFVGCYLDVSIWRR